MKKKTDPSLPEGYSGWISSIQLPDGRKYKLKCEIVQAHPLTCPKCGGNVTMNMGWGKCDYCGTNYSAVVKIEEG